ncbi:MAG: hypothetical protein ACK4OM_00570 [Alphaproteobacteria bacterium]
MLGTVRLLGDQYKGLLDTLTSNGSDPLHPSVEKVTNIIKQRITDYHPEEDEYKPYDEKIIEYIEKLQEECKQKSNSQKTWKDKSQNSPAAKSRF